jgi:magnesium-transporting ATPase (P-type)
MQQDGCEIYKSESMFGKSGRSARINALLLPFAYVCYNMITILLPLLLLLLPHPPLLLVRGRRRLLLQRRHRGYFFSVAVVVRLILFSSGFLNYYYYLFIYLGFVSGCCDFVIIDILFDKILLAFPPNKTGKIL